MTAQAWTQQVAGLIVGIDGPSGSGKSSVSREVARRLALGYLDTGAMYRAAAWWCLAGDVDTSDAEAVAERVAALDWTISTDPDDQRLIIDSIDVTETIRGSEVSSAVSAVSSVPRVRELLIAAQRTIIADEAAGGFSLGRGVVAEGRDITTVVAPDAPVRLLLTASEEARLARRSLELHGSAGSEAVAAIKSSVVDRDKADSKVTSFLSAADGVVELDTTELDFEDVVDVVLHRIEEIVTQPGADDAHVR